MAFWLELVPHLHSLDIGLFPSTYLPSQSEVLSPLRVSFEGYRDDDAETLPARDAESVLAQFRPSRLSLARLSSARVPAETSGAPPLISVQPGFRFVLEGERQQGRT